MRKTNGRVCGSIEDRINRFMRMLLEWQYDLRKSEKKSNSYYFTKYNIGKYSSKYFCNLMDVTIDRNYVINLMDKIGNDRIEYDKNLRKMV